MKKIIALFLILLFVCTLVACGSGNKSSAESSSEFSIVGTWKNVGDTTHNQIQKGSIVSFDGSHCNVISPQDTYAFYKDGGSYKLDCTGLLGGTVSYTVEIVDNNNIRMITPINEVIELTRVG